MNLQQACNQVFSNITESEFYLTIDELKKEISKGGKNKVLAQSYLINLYNFINDGEIK